MGFVMALILMFVGLLVAGPVGAIIGLLLGIASALMGKKKS